MKSRLQLLLILAVVAFPYAFYTFFAGGLSGAAPPASPALAGEKDRTVRRLLGVGSVSATIKLPKDKPHTLYAALMIEDGKLFGHHGLLWNTGDNYAELAWAKQDGHWCATFWTKGASSRSDNADWMRHLRSGVNYENPDGRPLGQFEGFNVYAYEFSLECRDGREDLTVSSSFQTELERRKYMVVLGVRFFATDAELSKARSEIGEKMRKQAEPNAAKRTDDAGQ